MRQVTQGRVGNQLDVSAVEVVMDPAQVLSVQRSAAAVAVDDAVLAYIVAITRATRDWHGIDTGAGPRAGIALLRCARAAALLNGHPFVTPDDVKAIAPAVLRHRVKLSADLEIEGYRPDQVLGDLLSDLKAPRQ